MKRQSKKSAREHRRPGRRRTLRRHPHRKHKPARPGTGTPPPPADFAVTPTSAELTFTYGDWDNSQYVSVSFQNAMGDVSFGVNNVPGSGYGFEWQPGDGRVAVWLGEDAEVGDREFTFTFEDSLGRQAGLVLAGHVVSS